MTNRATLLALASRVEAATGADRELDAAIAVAVSDDVGAWVVEPSPSSLFSHQPGWFCTSDNRSHKAPAYTASLDAAMSLVPSEAYWRLGHDGDGADPAEYKADVIVPKLGGVDARGRAIAATPPLALTAAACRAISGSLPND